LKLKTDTVVVPIAVLIVAIVCFQAGAALAKGLFPVVGASGAAALRLALAAIMLLAVWRPWRMRVSPREVRVIVIYGLALGWMNFFFYLSLRSIPLGIAVALEFTGPLGLAMASSRRAIDFLWILMAVLGLLACGWFWGLARFRRDWLTEPLYVTTGLILNILIKGWFASEAGRQSFDQALPIDRLLSCAGKPRRFARDVGKQGLSVQGEADRGSAEREASQPLTRDGEDEIRFALGRREIECHASAGLAPVLENQREMLHPGPAAAHRAFKFGEQAAQRKQERLDPVGFGGQFQA